MDSSDADEMPFHMSGVPQTSSSPRRLSHATARRAHSLPPATADAEDVFFCSHLWPWSEEGRGIQAIARAAAQAARLEGGAIPAAQAVADALRLCGHHDATVATTTPLGITRMRHSHVLVTAREGTLLVDTDFRDQFSVQFGSEKLERLLDTLPDVVVSRPQDVAAVARRLACIVAAEFEQAGRALPPWRRPDRVRDRWVCHIKMKKNASHSKFKTEALA